MNYMFIEDNLLLTILFVIKRLNRDLKEKIIQIIEDDKFREEFPMEYILFGYEEIVDNFMDISDYYFSE